MTLTILFIYLLFFLLGLIGCIFKKYLVVLFAFFAFIPSYTFFSGALDQAMRLGIFSWFILAVLFLKRKTKINWFAIYILWFVESVAGVIGYLAHGLPLIDGLGTVFTPAGLSLQYVLLAGVILAGREELDRFVIWFIFFAVCFYVLGGIYQKYVVGHLIFLNPNQLSIINPFYFDDGRLTGLFAESSHLTATVLNIAFSFQLAKLIYRKHTIKDDIILGIILLGILLAQNRGNYVAVIMVFIYLLTIGRNKQQSKYVIVLVGALLIVAYMYLPDLLGQGQFETRLTDPTNVFARLDIYKRFFENFYIILQTTIVGYGFSVAKVLGTDYFGYLSSLGLSENQVANWIAAFGWLATIVLVVIAFLEVKKLYIYLKLHFEKDWIGNGLIFSWISLFFAFSVNFDTNFLIPLIYLLTEIWIQEKRKNIELQYLSIVNEKSFYSFA